MVDSCGVFTTEHKVHSHRSACCGNIKQGGLMASVPLSRHVERRTCGLSSSPAGMTGLHSQYHTVPSMNNHYTTQASYLVPNILIKSCRYGNFPKGQFLILLECVPRNVPHVCGYRHLNQIKHAGHSSTYSLQGSDNLPSLSTQPY